MKLIDYAAEIFIDEGQPSTTSIPAIAFYLRGAVGKLNVILHEGFSVDPITYEISPTPSIQAVAILKQIFKVYNLEVQIRNMMNNGILDSVVSFNDEGTKVTKLNKNEMAKTFIQWRKDEILILNGLIASYNIDVSVPSQVAGDDTCPGVFTSENWGQFPGYNGSIAGRGGF